MSANINKRNYIVSPQEKLYAIHRVQSGETKAAVARDIGVPESTLRGWCKNEDKISYLSKKRKMDESPTFDTSVNDYSYQPDSTNLGESNTTNNVSEMQNNKAELSRLGLELGLNSPEMPKLNNSTDNLLLSHWNALLLQQMNNKSDNNSITNGNSNVLGTTSQTSILSKISTKLKTPAPRLKRFQNGLMHPPVSNVPSTNFNINCNQNSWFWNWYQQTAHNEPQTKTILTTQPQNDQNARNLCVRDSNKTGIKCRSVLDNLFNNDNLPANNEETEENTLSHQEAIQHGEKFLRWLEAHSGPSFTAVQIMQFKTLLNNVKSGIDKKKCDIVHKSKVKRK